MSNHPLYPKAAGTPLWLSHAETTNTEALYEEPEAKLVSPGYGTSEPRQSRVGEFLRIAVKEQDLFHKSLIESIHKSIGMDMEKHFSGMLFAAEPSKVDEPLTLDVLLQAKKSVERIDVKLKLDEKEVEKSIFGFDEPRQLGKTRLFAEAYGASPQKIATMLDGFHAQPLVPTVQQTMEQLDDRLGAAMALLVDIRAGILRNASDTVWMGPCETVVDAITAFLGDAERVNPEEGD